MQEIINNAVEFIKTLFSQDYTGHDYYHSMRVYRTAVAISNKENADMLIVSLASLLHDVDDIKLFPNTNKNKDNAIKFLESQGISKDNIDAIIEIINEVSFSGKDSVVPKTIEGKCVQDADRLDAMGAIGIARAFAYGGHHSRAMFDPEIKAVMNMNKDEYQKHNSTTINHFYEKLFLLKDLMNTKSAKIIATEREQFMKKYIKEFMIEWNEEDIAQLDL